MANFGNARRGCEAVGIRLDNASITTTAVPSAATAGIAVPTSPRMRARCHLELVKGAASGTRTARVKVFGYRSYINTQAPDGELTELASSGYWVEIFDTGELSDAADFKRSYLLEGASDFARLATQILTNGGTTPTLTTVLSFAGAQ